MATVLNTYGKWDQAIDGHPPQFHAALIVLLTAAVANDHSHAEVLSIIVNNQHPLRSDRLLLRDAVAAVEDDVTGLRAWFSAAPRSIGGPDEERWHNPGLVSQVHASRLPLTDQDRRVFDGERYAWEDDESLPSTVASALSVPDAD